MSDFEEVSEDIGAGQPMAIAVVENEEMGAFDTHLVVGGFRDEERAKACADLLKDILIADGFAARLERLQ